MKINLMGQVFEIEKANIDSIGGNFGDILYNDEKIRIADHLKGYEKLLTLLHEINHYIMRHSCASYKVSDEEKEYLCEVFANGWATIMKSNPNLQEILNAD